MKTLQLPGLPGYWALLAIVTQGDVPVFAGTLLYSNPHEAVP